MIPVFLTPIKTRDGITLEGIVVEPQRKGNTALIWIHGLGSRFYTSQTLIREFSLRCQQNGIGYFKFNTRGHDVVNRDGKKKNYIGAAFEKFEECVLDIRAMVLFARRLGYTKVILAGHSTGANKALYYCYKTRDPAVEGLVLLGPVSNIAYDQKMMGLVKWRHGLATARRLKIKKPTTLMPQEFGLQTARRFWSASNPGENEDTFPYYNPAAQWEALKSVRIPLAVILGSRDEYRDRPIKKILDAFRAHATSTKSFFGIIIKDANHGFLKREKEFSRIIIRWVVQAIE